MQLALLGNGTEVLTAARSLLAAGHTLTHIGPFDDTNTSSLIEIEAQTGAVRVRDHLELLQLGVNDILMLSYAPLIKVEEIAQARFFNVHYALLPRFRGMHGLIWSLINDEPEVGYTLHLVDEGVDSGPIYHQGRVPVTDQDTTLTLRPQIDALLERELGDAFCRIEAGLQPIPQDPAKAVVVSRRRPEDGLIDWNWPARRVFNHIRALTPPATPGAFSLYKSQHIVLTRATFCHNPGYFSPVGKVLCFQGEAAWVKCGDTVIQIDALSVDRNEVSPRQVLKIGGILAGR